MTIKIPNENIADGILSFLGKKRAVIIPSATGKYVYSQARKESWLKSLFRSKNSTLPNGLMYLSDFTQIMNKQKTNSPINANDKRS